MLQVTHHDPGGPPAAFMNLEMSLAKRTLVGPAVLAGAAFGVQQYRGHELLSKACVAAKGRGQGQELTWLFRVLSTGRGLCMGYVLRL